MAPKVEWAVALAALSGAVPLWFTKDRSVGPADIVEEPITLVPEDRDRLACLRDRPVGRYACAYRTEGQGPDASTAKPNVIAPYLTTERALYLIPGLFEQTAVSEFASRHLGGVRFTARCRLKLVDRIDDYAFRFGTDTPWGKGQPAWVAEPVSCVVTKD